MSLGVEGAGTRSGPGGDRLSCEPTCLIVEDQVLIGMSLEAYLEEIGFGSCETIPSAAEALTWLGSNTPTVAILDYSLKDGPCTGLVHLLRERGVPFIIYSGHKRDAACRELANVPWLCKPCDRAALLAALIQAAPALRSWNASVAA